ncbi:unnamed protein product, partial [Phaeothamnion confervicola]
VEPDPAFVELVHKHGFSRNGARRAAIATGHAGVDVLLAWCAEHVHDAAFDAPLPPPRRRHSPKNGAGRV